MKRGIDSDVDFDQVRLLLEEDILGSNSHKESNLYRVSLLRMQKQILTQLARPVLSRPSSRRPTWKATVLACRFLLRYCLKSTTHEEELVNLPLVLHSPAMSVGSEVSPILRPKIHLHV
jgi:hypothetical protein